MSKEYTIFVLDGSKSMDCVSDGERDTDFQRALRYIFGYFMQQLIKNRKSDRLALIVYSGSSTDVFYNNSTFSLSNVESYYTDSIRFHEGDAGSTGRFDMVDALYQALGLFSKNIKNKFTRNLYLFTNGALPVGDINRIAPYKDMINDSAISITLALLAHDKNQETKTVMDDLTTQLKNTTMIDFDKMVNTGPPLKLIGPRCQTESYMGLGEIGSAGEDFDKMVHLQVQVYPGVRVQSQVSGHSYYIDPELGNVTKVSVDSQYYIKKTSDLEEEDENEPDSQGKAEERERVLRADCTPGFKYSNRDVLALSQELDEATTLETTASINLLGFYPKDKFPFAYLTDESHYVIPNPKYQEDNRIGYNSLVKAMIDLNYVALVRYVAKENLEVQVCTAFPREVVLGDQTGNILVLVRAAMKEDEKIGRFPKLEEAKDSNGDDLMEQFIKSKRLRNDVNFNPYVIDNDKISLTQSEPGSKPITDETSLDKMLLSSNPATRRFNYYLEKILFQSLRLENSLKEFLREDKFVEKYLSKGEQSTLFNLDSILDAHEKFLYTSDHENANEIALKLQSKLDVKYKIQAKPEPKKRAYTTAFGPQPNDGKFDEYFDIEDLLAG
ncbi:ATP-dependent DNA helicase II subunit 2 [Candida viswanathii]|uniref:DNA helicase n=1 Tax=Candida viswanathii TaxID=5486 RepID=A0A367Y8Q5_9ASCO|nr:ATP-dependent DNA helicase II subunit 2 [Candida viswanathii]